MTSDPLWAPTRATEPLSPDYVALFDRYAPVLRIAWHQAFGHGFDEWQEDLLRRITELTPEGHLRHRQFFVSLGRQNGKTEIASALGLLFMLHLRDALVIGIATSVEQAGLVYRRSMQAINRNRALAKRFAALTETRGIRSITGGTFQIKAAKSAALQGLPIDLGLCDEVHLLKRELWTDLVNGLGGRPDCMVVGITTAGDDDSELLKTLYELAESGSIGFAIWEAPEAVIPADDETLADYLRAANPAIACGRVDVRIVIEDVRNMAPAEAIRYRLNRFTSTDSTYVALGDWRALAGPVNKRGPVTFAVDRSPGWEHATIAAAWTADDGLIETQIVASIAAPTLEKIKSVCLELAAKNPDAQFIADGYSLKDLPDEMKAFGYRTQVARIGDVYGAASRFFALVKQKHIRHVDDPLMRQQLPRVKTKNSGEHYKLVRATKASSIDSVVATVTAVYFAETDKGNVLQMF